MFEKIIKIIKHIANSYLISEVIKNDLEDTFGKYLNELMEINKQNINYINSIFNDEDYIYFPKLVDEDIIYCFSYGYYNYKCGALNPTEMPVILDNEEKCFNKEKIIENLREKFKKEKKYINLLEKYFSKINILYDKLKEIKYQFDVDWLKKTYRNS